MDHFSGYLHVVEENPTYVLGFNSPPKSGKDTVALKIAEHLHQGGINRSIQSLAAPMREIAMEMTGLTTFREYNDFKDVPNPLFKLANSEGTHNIRQFMIALSESFIKPIYGHDFWARLLIAKNKWWGKERILVMIPDFGFDVETKVIVDSVGEKNFCMVRLARQGTDFSSDSRNYVECPNMILVDNNGTPAAAADAILLHLVEKLGWNLSANATK